MNQPNPGDGHISGDAAGGERIPAWYVEVLGKAGWEPLRSLPGKISCYASYDEAVAGAIREWERSDRPTRPAPVSGPD